MLKSNYIEGATWVSNGKEEKIVAGDVLQQHLNDGWNKGMLISNPATEKIKKKPGPKPKPEPKPEIEP